MLSKPMPNEQKLLTVGHGATPQADFEDLLQAAGVASLVDVRIGPGSRKYPHFGRTHMEQWLPAAGITYRWEQRLGGFRKLPPGSPDTSLRNDSFRAYAAYMRTAEFTAALSQLLADAADQRPPSCAAKRSGGAAIAASSQIIAFCWTHCPSVISRQEPSWSPTSLRPE